MGIRGRFVLGLWGLAVVAPASMAAGPDEPVSPPATASKHTHKGLFGRHHCVECQRARVKARDGVDMPPPPPLDPGVVHGGSVVQGDCPACQQSAHQHQMAAADPNAPGIAVVGDMMPGAEPEPVGMATVHPHGTPMMVGRSRPGGPLDPAVMPSAMPPAQTALGTPGHERPHIIAHVFGLRSPGTLSRKRADAERQKHAAIAYGSNNLPVTELPASVVYGKGAH